MGRIAFLTLCVLSMVGAWGASRARADAPVAPVTAFDHRFAVGVYALGWEGNYAAGGLGGRVRWDAFPALGFEVFAEHLLVEHAGSLRHDHPVGFNAFIPLRLSEHFRLKPFIGFCAVLSFVDPVQQGGERADDILFGAHAGVGLDYSFSQHWSAFLDVQGIAYAGHARYESGWSSALEGNVRVWGTLQAALGLQFHFIEP